MRRLVVGSLVAVLLAFGGYFALGEWRSDGPDTETTPSGAWHLDLRPVEDDTERPCGRPPYRACTEDGLITQTDEASTP